MLDTPLSASNAHHGLLSTNHQESYQRPQCSHPRNTGQREEMLRRLLYSKFSQEVLQELSSAGEELRVIESTTRRDYKMEGFVPQTPQAAKNHDYATEQPLTFWTENLQHITGVSDVRSRDTPFKRSSAFTTPVSQYLDSPAPHSVDTHPNM